MKLSHLYIMCAAALLTTACTSEAEIASDVVLGNRKQMTFTVSQEGDSGAQTRVAFNSATQLIWEEGDKIGIYDGTATNAEFTLIGAGGTAKGAFDGEANESSSYTAVYPYSADMTITDGMVTGVTLKATQTATPNSFDKSAVIFIAQSPNKKLEFKTAVSFVKVITSFACKQIVLSTDKEIAGTGTLYYNSDAPSITFASNTSKTITLKPATGETIAAGTYYIAVKPGELTSGWSIAFTSSDYNVYTRKAGSAMELTRGHIRSIGNFSTNGTWTSTSRGEIVKADQEVDLGLTIQNADGKQYRVIFANANLTSSGIAEKESEFGDYFAWGATEPWYSSLDMSASPWTATWIPGKENGYVSDNNPTLSKEYGANEVLSTLDDPARKILGGDWQLPTKEIWRALTEANKTTVIWGNNGDFHFINSEKGMRITKNDGSGTYLFLPAASGVYVTSFNPVGSDGNYWSGTAYSSTQACQLYFYSGYAGANHIFDRCYGFSVRPVRLVAE